MAYWLVLVDVPKIKAYILASRGLAQMRGASNLLEQASREGTIAALEALGGQGNARLERQARGEGTIAFDPSRSIDDGTSDWELVFAGGGLAQLLFKDRDRAAEFVVRIRDEYRRRTRSATVVCAAVECADLEQGYGGAVRRAANDVSQQKVGFGDQARPAALVGGAFLEPCVECGVLPATVRAQIRGPIVRSVCSSCETKQRRGDDLRRGGLPGERYALQRAEEEVERLRPDQLHVPRELDDLAASSHPEGYVAYIEADGDGVGEKIRSLETKEHYRVFSRALESATREAWADAIVECVRADASIVAVLPVSLLVAGGDDLLALCSPRIALQLVDRFSTSYGPRFAAAVRDAGVSLPKGLDPAQMSISAGVVIAHKNFPFAEMQRLGKKLQQQAKQLSRSQRTTGRSGGAVDFQMTTAHALPSLTEQRAEGMTLADGRRLYARPYRVGPEGLGRLVGYAGALARSSPARSRLRAFEDILRTDPETSTRDFRVALARMRSGDDPFKRLLADYGSRDGDPWITDAGTGRFTPVLDLVEVAELMR